MNFYVYILISLLKENWSYVGSASDLNQRINDHKYGKVRSTKGFRPLKLIYFEKYNTEIEALKRERYLKSGFGREEKANIISVYSGIV